jgi:hypothetical protein
MTSGRCLESLDLQRPSFQAVLAIDLKGDDVSSGETATSLLIIRLPTLEPSDLPVRMMEWNDVGMASFAINMIR